MFSVIYGDEGSVVNLGPFDTREEAIDAARLAHKRAEFDVRDTPIYLLDKNHQMATIDEDEITKDKYAGYTPGPWVNDKSHPEWERNVIWAGNQVIAHVVDDQHHNADANAALIAAAPELLRALEMALESLDMAGIPEEWDCRSVVRKALAKVTN
jgi:hypothetical protein